MRTIFKYQTKAKWSLHVDENGLPVVGYYGGGEPREYGTPLGRRLDPGVNVLMDGELMLIGTSRGRSAAHFDLTDRAGQRFHMTLQGTADLLNALALNEGELDMQRWVFPETEEEVTGPVILGRWTCVKQGTDVSLTMWKGPITEIQKKIVS